ncbi:hypothetical protein Bca52824_063756 [Brassica carinata]|uniref:Uncharacterized protein n=1 Tax=Brassica carinata TaxID=52824 RepID=A0A8X7QF01_BRACI|nr:hypothetical protein Bca52824_063756 [Brassica carinata]
MRLYTVVVGGYGGDGRREGEGYGSGGGGEYRSGGCSGYGGWLWMMRSWIQRYGGGRREGGTVVVEVAIE